ncbi:hypothetical protein OAT18_02955 [Tenacibaculum sp.]|nr:hypothetical protein [Tenacibaculum sp.]
MKKIIFLLTVFTMVFASCEPLEDINAEIDAINNPIVGDATFTLSDEDYDDLELSRGRFNSLDDAKTALPAFLSKKFPVWGKGSSALVGFNLNIGRAFNLDNYNLRQPDYALSGSISLAFPSTSTPADYLVDVIKANYADAKEGDYVSAVYYQYTGVTTTITPKVSFEDNFDYGATGGALTAISSGVWENHSGASNELLYKTESLSMTGYPSSNVGGSLTVSTSGSEDVSDYFTPISSGTVYASTLVNLSEVSTGTYTFHLRDASFGFRARVGAKDNGSGKILFGIGASSSSLTYGSTSFDLNTTYLLVSSYNIETGVSNLYVLSAIETLEPTEPEATNNGSAGTIISGVSIRQGFGGPTATFDGIRVANSWSSIMSNATLPDEVVGDKIEDNAIYIYKDNSWKAASSLNSSYLISDADFTSMGITNFGSSIPAENYLPTFLGLKFPYAQEAEKLNVLYKYVSSSSGAQTRGNLYTKLGSVWVAHESTISTDFQFGHDGNEWAPDNTIKYTLTAADYTLVASTLKNEEGYVAASSNLEGFGNFNRTGDADPGGVLASGTSNWNDFMMIRALGIVLNKLDASAAENQKYAISFNMYDGSSGVGLFRMIKNASGEWVVQ